MPMGKRKEKTSTCRGKQGLFELLRDKRKKKHYRLHSPGDEWGEIVEKRHARGRVMAPRHQREPNGCRNLSSHDQQERNRPRPTRTAPTNPPGDED